MPHNRPSWSGMTLIEILLVMAIIGILVVLIFPGYQQQLLTSRRQDGANQLLKIKMQQESYRLKHARYAEAAQLSLPTSEYFDFSVVNISATTYTLVALAKGSQTEDGSCQTLALDQSMNKTPADCWR